MTVRRFAKPAAASAAGADLAELPAWNLADLYPGTDSPEVTAELARVREETKAFAAAWRGRIADTAKEAGAGARLAEAVRAYEALCDRIGKLMSYAGLTFAADTSDPAVAKFYGDMQSAINEITTQLLFFELELNKLDDAEIEAALADTGLAHYRPWVADIRMERPHQLGEELERLFHEKAVTGAAAWNRLFDQTMASLEFAVRGEKLGLEATLNLLLSPREAERRASAEALSATLLQNARLFTLVTNTLARDKAIGDRWRHFADIADSRHLDNRVEREVVEALVAAVRGAYPRLSHRYYALKARWLGKDALDHWDRNAPLPHTDDRTIGWDEARATVLDAYSGFAPEMAAIARRFFDERWIDAAVRPGKSPGAFSHPTVPSAHPYVLLNYQGKPRDVMTLAHELGHGVHQVLANPQGALMAPTPLTLAETASVFGEMLTFRSLLKATTDPAKRRAMLASKVEDMLNTVVRQIAFYSFERAVHLERRDGELTADRLGEIWLEVQGESLGPSVRLGPGYEVFWSYIPHFIHAPFYVYAYAFGDCLVNSLYAVYEKAEAGFAERYLDLLKAGGTKHHSELLAPFGLDARDPAFWQIGLGLIERMIDELEAGEAA